MGGVGRGKVSKACLPSRSRRPPETRRKLAGGKGSAAPSSVVVDGEDGRGEGGFIIFICLIFVRHISLYTLLDDEG